MCYRKECGCYCDECESDWGPPPACCDLKRTDEERAREVRARQMYSEGIEDWARLKDRISARVWFDCTYADRVFLAKAKIKLPWYEDEYEGRSEYSSRGYSSGATSLRHEIVKRDLMRYLIEDVSKVARKRRKHGLSTI